MTLDTHSTETKAALTPPSAKVPDNPPATTKVADPVNAPDAPDAPETKGRAALDDVLGEDKPIPFYRSAKLWIGLGLVVAAGAGFWLWQRQKAADAVPRYNTQAARMGDITLTIVANGTVQPIRTYAIGSELSGTVLRVNADVNDVVRKGQVLVELDTSTLRDQIVRAKAALASAQATVAQNAATMKEKQVALGRLDTVWQLSGGQVPSRAEMDIGRADLARARAATDIARAGVSDAQAALSSNQINLSKASIRAPADGVVLTRTVEPGSAVAASFQAVTLMTLASDLTRLRVWGYVDEADVGTVKEGQSATFTVSAFLNRQFPATVTRVGSGSTITDNVVTYLTYLDVSNQDLKLRPGMTATATIVATQRKNVLLVPNTALRFAPSEPAADTKKPSSGLLSSLTPRAATSRTSRAGAQTMNTASAKTIYVLKNGKPEAVPITPGISDGQMTEIVSGSLAAGMLVITNQQAVKAK